MQNICWRSKAGRAGRGLLAAVMAAQAVTASAATLYVWQSSPSPAPPYATWASASTNIQDAIDAATDGDDIVVTNGVYGIGGRAIFDGPSNRVAVTKPVRLCSVNGPEATTVVGNQVGGTNNGESAVRCVFLCNGASLTGFTLSGGATLLVGDDDILDSGGGVFCQGPSAVVSNCVISGNIANYAGGGASGGTLLNCRLERNRSNIGAGATDAALIHCTLAENVASFAGGAAYASTLTNCVLTNNSAWRGGGSCVSLLDSCIVSSNYAISSGGGAFGGTIISSTLSMNLAGTGGAADQSSLAQSTVTNNRSSGDGGGVFASELRGCQLRNNVAGDDGGGAADSTLINCLLTGNSADGGGGAERSTLIHCTVTGNSAGIGGGTEDCISTNCIVYFNSAPAGDNYPMNVLAGSFSYSCTTPLPLTGSGNITNEPAYVDAATDNYRLRPGSPGIDAGTNLSAIVSFDFNGIPRPLDGNRDGVAGFDMGAYEFNPLLFTSITKVGNNTRLCWFDTLPGMQLEAASSLANSVWTNVPFASGTNCVELPLNSTNTFFRLVKP